MLDIVSKIIVETCFQMQQLTSKQVSCPINKNHLVTEHTISTHCEKCSLKSAGYSPEDQFLSDPLSDSKCNIKLSVAKKIEVFSGARSMKSDFKSGKKCFIYAVVIELCNFLIFLCGNFY